MNERILGIGERLDIGEDDFNDIKRTSRKRRFALYVIAITAPIASFIAGFLIGWEAAPPQYHSYPFVATAVAGSVLVDKRKKTFLGVLILSIIAFIFSFALSTSTIDQNFGGSLRYGVSDCERAGPVLKATRY